MIDLIRKRCVAIDSVIKDLNMEYHAIKSKVLREEYKKWKKELTREEVNHWDQISECSGNAAV